MYKIIGILFILLILAFFVKKKIVEPYANPIKYNDCSAHVDRNNINVSRNITFLTDNKIDYNFIKNEVSKMKRQYRRL